MSPLSAMCIVNISSVTFALNDVFSGQEVPNFNADLSLSYYNYLKHSDTFKQHFPAPDRLLSYII